MNQVHEPQEWQQGEYTVSTDKSRLNIETVHTFISRDSYWAQGRKRETMERAIAHSECFGLYRGEEQVGFARVVTDYATFAWIADVFVLPPHRGQGLAQWVIECILAHPKLQGLRRFVLATRDAHEVYRRSGFAELEAPERWMSRIGPGYEQK